MANLDDSISSSNELNLSCNIIAFFGYFETVLNRTSMVFDCSRRRNILCTDNFQDFRNRLIFSLTFSF